MLHYILQTIAFQLFFLIIYDVFLKKETFFNCNRAYLLITALLSVLLPFVKLNSIKAIVPEQFVIRLPEVIIGETPKKSSVMDIFFTQQEVIAEPVFVWSWTYILYIGMSFAALLLLFKIGKLLWLMSKNPKRWKGNLLIIKLLNSTSAFSFFHYIFLGEKIKTEDQQAILEHEMVHVTHKHTLDLLFFEVMRIAFWFNPLVYMYQNRITELHEFIADAKAVKLQNKKVYYQNLLAQVFDTNKISFVNPFFKQSLIKKRIAMLSKSKSKQIHLVKYALLFPLIFGMLMYTSSYAQKVKKVETIEDEAATQELSDKELQQKYYDELATLNKKNINLLDVFSDYMPKSDKYILSREELYKQNAFFKYMFNKRKEQLKEDGIYSEEDKEKLSRFNKYETYQEYLDYKKTDEAKLAWESNTKDGVLRLIVDDTKNYTEEEQKRYDKKMEMIENDDYFHSLLITDGKTSVKMQFHSIGDKKIPHPDDKDNIELIEKSTDIEVPFAVIEEVPTFTFCETLKTNEERKKCMSDNIAEHVNKNFNVDIAKEKGLTGRQRISVMFKIDKEGKVRDIKARAAHPDLEAEAKRVIASLPMFIPGKQKGEAVVVPYSLPIVFQISDSQDDAVINNNKQITKKINTINEALNEENKANKLSNIPFSVVEEAPVFKGCETGTTNDERKKCTTLAIATHVNSNFNTKLSKTLGLTGKQRISVMFKIGKEGQVSEIKARAAHPDLEAEAKRVIGNLPIFIPGKQKGESVVVSYSLPILFQVH